MIHIMFGICFALWIYGSFYAKVIFSKPTNESDWTFLEAHAACLIIKFLGGFGAEKNHDGMQHMDSTSKSCVSRTTSKL